MGQLQFGYHGGLFGLRIATTSALFQTLGTLRFLKQEERNLHSQDFTVWSINSGPGAFPGLEGRHELFYGEITRETLTIWC